ncbi:helix-turn-helix domain-containing protein [Chryseobacterium sp. Ch-15]|uniref:AraC family transcriptional regulator n=1 Tax=Chryseobacterium muglaense TaxID=2893752 RepID=A0A9Q3UV07_9FLAO|nr:helix-turn-helix domain-containing protein [Chryseobacterium muglaense]MBD3903318.1 AraC family transcriptional regulator [Chryseobacterium muglaense]MCC9036148.1 helix-turn-helix domain-containing protein [Chryseobacterium muglaense]MCM2553277.1 helix-turn-helix domain-containing protein [Chryseobacterium muglaense]
MKLIPTIEPSTFKKSMMYFYDQMLFGKKHYDDFFIHHLSKPVYELKLPILPHRQTVHYLIFLTEGSMTKKSGIESYTVCKNSLFLLPKGQITDTTKFSYDISGYFVHFSEDYLISKNFDFTEWMNIPVIGLAQEETVNLVNLLQRMEYVHNNDYNGGLLKSYLNVVLTEIFYISKNVAGKSLTTVEKIVQDYKRSLMANCTKERSTFFYAEQLHITPNHLNKCVKSVLNKSASELLNEMIILEAKVLMSENQLNISELAFAMGFEDPSYFGRFFKKHTKLTPSEYLSRIDLS